MMLSQSFLASMQAQKLESFLIFPLALVSKIIIIFIMISQFLPVKNYVCMCVFQFSANISSLTLVLDTEVLNFSISLSD